MAKITDVARAAGVSVATVSRVLNQPGVVAPDKRQRVLDAVRALNYTPNTLAHALRAGQVKTVALLVGDISQPFHGALAKALDREGERHGYRVLLRDLDNKEERLVKALDELTTSDTYGVVLATPDDLGMAPVRAAITRAQGRGLVIVCSSQVIENSATAAIVPRYQAISRLATHHLVTAGLKSLIFVGGSDDSPLSRERRLGFEHACAEMGVSVDPDFVLDGEFAVEPSYQSLRALFKRRLGRDFGPGSDRPRFGIIAVNMRMVIGAFQAADEFGLRVPDDVALVCCEELPLATEWRPPVTTVGIDFATLAEATFAALIAGSEAPAVTFVPHRLTVRVSSMLPGAQAILA
jgi:DNA-binding LacI/PurR family transcriptional regulator